MDSQGSPPVHHPPHHLQSLPPHHPHPHPHQQTPLHNTMTPPHPPTPPPHQQEQQPNNSYILPNNNNNNNNHHNNLNIPANNIFQQQQQQQQQNIQQFPFNSITGQNPKPNLDYSDGSSTKKKRGRPRKYTANDGNNIGLGLNPTPLTQVSSVDSGGGGGGDNGAASSENPSKKARGRPLGSGKKQQQETLGAVGFGFTPHLINVNIGEDIASKVMSFSQQGPRAICILSATGVVCNVTLRQPSMGGGTVTYEGRFEIISLSGSFLLSESNGSRSRTGGLSVSLSGPDGRVLGGGVAGMLIAATPVQVVVGSFIAEKEKPKPKAPSSTPPPNMLNFGVSVTEASSPSPGASSDSSDENGGSPLSHERGPFGNAPQPMHGMPTTYWGQTM
ncbi:AT-hook motif nuclear-localized protein 10-like [Lycium barbarum]|uniref:AT-hook motif nuclear-localized protein 10-like n=1 Tax=Lycium barbarum TaxID=112863 RepID=UPI00293EAEF7|nr:AT-hook motif nuclear-localized protein 10-like [Lycium barbarum]